MCIKLGLRGAMAGRICRCRVAPRVMGAFLLVLLPAAAGCRQAAPVQPYPEQPSVLESPAAEPQVIVQPPPPTIEPLPEPEPVPTGPRQFDVSRVGIQPERPLSILQKMHEDRPARVSASMETDNFLVINTENVAHLQLDMLNLPRREAGRLILRLDGQGLEITGRANRIVYLRRNAAGNWTFVRQPELVPEGSRGVAP